MGAVGLTGLIAAAAAAAMQCRHGRARFAGFWMTVAVICLAEAFFLIRRQALKEAEPFWSPPTRRVAQAVCAGVFCGLRGGLDFSLAPAGRRIGCLAAGAGLDGALRMRPPRCRILHAARLQAFWLGLHRRRLPAGRNRYVWPARLPLSTANWAMGVLFGGAHLAYGVYLYFTEQRGNATVNPEPFLQIDRVIHEKGRLPIMSLLAAATELSFTELRDTLKMTDGNLSVHIRPCKRPVLFP